MNGNRAYYVLFSRNLVTNKIERGPTFTDIREARSRVALACSNPTMGPRQWGIETTYSTNDIVQPLIETDKPTGNL
jgi:hypothetical protein